MIGWPGTIASTGSATSSATVPADGTQIRDLATRAGDDGDGCRGILGVNRALLAGRPQTGGLISLLGAGEVGKRRVDAAVALSGSCCEVATSLVDLPQSKLALGVIHDSDRLRFGLSGVDAVEACALAPVLREFPLLRCRDCLTGKFRRCPAFGAGDARRSTGPPREIASTSKKKRKRKGAVYAAPVTALVGPFTPTRHYSGLARRNCSQNA
jgi:hypothetical protein